MTDEQRQLKEHFLDPEVRDGVEVSTELKAVWKVLLDILEEIARICTKYDLKWTLEGGSLLGAIRHRGFIPWDDDIDVVMPREDYDKLVRVMPRELPSYYFMQTLFTDKDFHIPHVMVRDSRTTGIDPFHVRNKKTFNMGVRVDVLALDGMPKSRFVRKVILWYERFVMAGVYCDIHRYQNSNFIGKVITVFGTILKKVLGNRLLYWFRELPFRLSKMSKCEWCCSLTARNFWHPHSIRKVEWFSEFVLVPFEYLTVPVPRGYDKILTQQFGDWQTPIRGGAYHGELVFDVNVDWKTTLIKKYGYTDSDFVR